MKLTAIKLSVAAVLLCLGSCSFTTHITMPAPVIQEITQAAKSSTCPVYVLPPATDLPPVPIARMQGTAPADIDAKINILLDALKEARKVHQEREATLKSSYQQYLAICSAAAQ
jgi:hypothetical protein